ncbi:ATP-binding protein [Reinekea sp.]|jgi:two-component system sensor histidine kinase/response regulator|uniref:ATP-binding protein n=1 Tax=Reinekea sp. TaxID=1970455 RepID=UPI003988C54C
MKISLINSLGLSKKSIPVGSALILFVVCLGIYYGLSEYTKHNILERHQLKLLSVNQVNHSALQGQVAKSKRMVEFLGAIPSITGITRAMLNSDLDPASGLTTDQWKSQLETTLVAFLGGNPDVRQIRFIGKQNNGRELVRVESRSSLVTAIPDELLQEKGDTDYFKAIEKLNPNETYLSTISLNREYGVVEKPIWPTYRVAKAVYDDNYNFFGFVIINFNATSLISTLKENYQRENLSIYLLNDDGFFITAPKASLEFGFDLDNLSANWSNLTSGATLPSTEETSKVVIDGVPSYIAANRLFLSNIAGGSNVLVSSFSDEDLIALWDEQRRIVIYFVIAIYIAVFLLISGYQRYLNRNSKLYEDQSRYEAIVSGSSDSIINIDINGRILSWNDSAAYMFGLNDKKGKGQRISDLIPTSASGSQLTAPVFKTIVSENSTKALEVNSKNSLGKSQILSISLSPVAPKGSAVKPSVAALIRDITESKENQEKIISINESLEQQVVERTEQLELATVEAVSANKTKSAFLANISHEIRTPLNGIGGMLELLAREALTDNQHSYVQMAKSSIATLSVLINDLLDLTKIESGKLDIEMAELNLIEITSSIAETMSLKAHEKGLTLLFDSTELEHEVIVSDPYRIKQILTNLVGNAIKFTEHGHVLIKVSSKKPDQLTSQSNINISVIDTGVGISTDQQKKLFQPFTQAQTSTARNYGGTGLGLSISKQLAMLLGGEIGLDSTINEGSHFTFSFSAHALEVKSFYTGFPDNIKIHCHVVMTDNLERSTLQKQLELWGIQVSLHNDVNSCLNIHAGEPLDLVIVDGGLLGGLFELLYSKLESEGDSKLIVVGECSLCEQYSARGNVPCSKISKPILPYQLYSTYKKLRHPHVDPKKLTTGADDKDIQSLEGANYNVLVVDDNEINRVVAQGLLGKFPIKAFAANDGAQALEFLNDPNNPKIDLILMDCQMPVLNGFDATREIRNGHAGQASINIPIVALTAGAMAGERDACLESGMNDFIAKPVDPDIFENKVFYWLNEKAKS